ncbi:MAG: hypothetical protein AAGJ81_06805 [Verrucomicrobiota bacterium]
MSKKNYKEYRAIAALLFVGLLTGSNHGSAGSTNTGISNSTGAIEMFSYKPLDGIDIENLLATDARVKEEFVAKQPGYINRYTTVSKDGTVFVFVHWDSMKSVRASQAKAMEDPLMGEYMGMMNQDTLVFHNLTVKQ